MEEMAQKALEQIEEKAYYNDMKKRGITNIFKYGIAFNNKKVVMRWEYLAMIGFNRRGI